MADSHSNAHKAGLLSDKVGFWVSLSCAVHCMATPIVLLLVPSLTAIVPGLEWLEYFAVGISFTLAAVQLYPEYLHHRKRAAVVLAGMGLTTLSLGMLWEGLGYEQLHIGTMAVGSLVMAAAFYVGHRLKHHA